MEAKVMLQWNSCIYLFIIGESLKDSSFWERVKNGYLKNFFRQIIRKMFGSNTYSYRLSPNHSFFKSWRKKYCTWKDITQKKKGTFQKIADKTKRWYKPETFLASHLLKQKYSKMLIFFPFARFKHCQLFLRIDD